MNPTTERLVEAQGETGHTINRLSLSLIAIGVFAVLVAGLPDSTVLTTATTVSVPLVGAASIKTALVLGPLALIALRVYLQIYLEHWNRLERLIEHRARARSLISAANAVRVPRISHRRHRLLRLYSGFVLYPLVPLVLGVFTWKAMALRDWGIPLIYATAVSAALVIPMPRPLRWRFRIGVPALALLPIFAGAGFLGALDDLRRPFALAMADFARADLKGLDLRDAQLTWADLSQADLTGARLDNARMFQANLGGAILLRARMPGAVLRRADLGRARLRKARLEGADLRDANLKEALMKDADLRGSSLLQTDLRDAFLGGADLEGATDWETARRGGAVLCRTTLPDGAVAEPDCDVEQAQREWVRRMTRDE